jgi:hypothetical protein
VTTRPHEARALLALGARDWSATPPTPEVHATLGGTAGASRVLVLLTDPTATLDVPSSGEGLVRVLELAPTHARPIHLDLRASSGGIAGLWAVSTGRLD